MTSAISDTDVRVDEDRIVVTYQSGCWPAGVLTGYREAKHFVLEHVIAFPGSPDSTLMRMLRAGIEEAWRRGFESVVYCLHDHYPITPALRSVGERLGFVPYATTTDRQWYVRHRP